MDNNNNNNKDYEKLFKEKMDEAKLIFNLSEEDKIIIKKLLQKKEIIKQKNGLFSTFQINRINNKIDKIRNKN